VPDPADSDHRNIERHLGSDTRFVVRVGSAGERLYDFDDPETGERREGLLTHEALRLKNDLDEAVGRP
jgi:hypothetical protein